MKKLTLVFFIPVLVIVGISAYLLTAESTPAPSVKKPATASAKVPDSSSQRDEIASTDQPAAQSEEADAPTDIAQQNTQPAASAAPADTAEAPVEGASSADEPAPEVIDNSSRQVLAMHSMIMAHASLRTPEETDPDSKENKEIMQTMITKALAARDASKANN
jgi:hypothetical protein